jgi:hypothetical protein
MPKDWPTSLQRRHVCSLALCNTQAHAPIDPAADRTMSHLCAFVSTPRPTCFEDPIPLLVDCVMVYRASLGQPAVWPSGTIGADSSQREGEHLLKRRLQNFFSTVMVACGGESAQCCEAE